ncbi:reverse transcriptase domain-containing protein [Tanacetum coccineum]
MPNSPVVLKEPEGSDDYTEVTYDKEKCLSEHYTASVTPPTYTTYIPFLATMEPTDTLLMGDDVISTIPARETDKFIKSSVDDLVPILRESEVTSDSDLECDMPIATYFPTTDVREEKLDIDLPLGEHLDTISMEDREVDFNPSRDIEELEHLLADNPIPVPREFDEPLGNSDSMSRSSETSDLFEDLIAEFGLDDLIPTEINDRTPFHLEDLRACFQSSNHAVFDHLHCISGFVHGLRPRNLVEHLSTYLPPTYKGLMEKTYTWIKQREVAANGAPNDQRDNFKRSRKSSWDNGRGHESKDRFSPYQGPNYGLLSSVSKTPREILATEKVAKTFKQPPWLPENSEKKIVENDQYPEQTITIGRQLQTKTNLKLQELLKAHTDVFAWTTAHMTGVPRTIMVGGEIFNAEDRVNESKHVESVKQKKRSLELERNEAIHTQVEELTKANIADPSKVKAISGLHPSKSVNEIQSLSKKLAAINCFLSKGTDKMLPFIRTLKNYKNGKIVQWTMEAYEAFRRMKELFEALSIVTAPRTLHGAELEYPELEKLMLALVYDARKLRRYFQAHPIQAIELGEHEIEFRERNSIKGHILADFLVETSLKKDKEIKDGEAKRKEPEPENAWKLFTDEASSSDGSEAGLMLVNPEGKEYTYNLMFEFETTNNKAEYEALLAGLRIAKEMKIQELIIFVDSQLVANQVNRLFEARQPVKSNTWKRQRSC